MNERPMATIEKLSQSELTLKDPTDDIRGRRVVDRDGQEIGTVEDLMIDSQEHKVRFLQIGAGGVLGIGEKRFLIPIDALTEVDDERVVIDQSGERISGAPEYQPDLVPAVDYLTDVYGWYGYTPYWGMDNIYPGHPLGRGPGPR